MDIPIPAQIREMADRRKYFFFYHPMGGYALGLPHIDYVQKPVDVEMQRELVNEFVGLSQETDYTLSIYNPYTQRAVEVPYDLPIPLFGEFVARLCEIQSYPVHVIGRNEIASSFVVNIPLVVSPSTSEGFRALVDQVVADAAL